MLYPSQPVQRCTFTFNNPFWETYPPPPPPPPPPPQRDLSDFFSTSICITGAVLLFLFLTVFLYFYITQTRQSSPASVAPVSTTNRREDENEEDGERDISGDHHFWRISTPGLHRSAIDSITVVGFKKEERIIDGTDCSVCLSEFEEDESLRLLPKCSHAFHVNCIDMWLLSHKNCPLCRAPVFSCEPRNKTTETTSHQAESGTSNGGEEEESSGSGNANVLPRSQSDLARHCGGSGRLETVRRSFSIGGSSLVKADEGSSDDVAGRSRRQFYSSFGVNFFSSSRRSRNQGSVLPTRMPSVSS